MIGRSIEGKNECFVCGELIAWGTIVMSTPGNMVAYTLPQNTAEECAIGKTENGDVKFEITCTCPNCRTKNKFIVEKKL